MHAERKYSQDGHRRIARGSAATIALLSITAMLAVPPVKDRVASTLDNMVLNFKAS
ncbi:MAG: hypothetical protein WC804_07985 [Sphingomonas sp.]|jgi:hypothetical protein|uniref:hypothetical protein n=1 Tax=Sphingomonas sp. TaxID=28214 RepID=UPI0035623922